MACPKCGCKVTYPYYEDDMQCDTMDERCAHCWHVFDVDTAADDDNFEQVNSHD